MLPNDSRRDTCCDVDGMCSAGPMVCVCVECHVSRHDAARSDIRACCHSSVSLAHD